MSACIPSLLPLFKMLIGGPGSKRSRITTTKSHNRTHTRTHDAPPNTKTKISKFSRMADEDPDEVPLQALHEQDSNSKEGVLPPESSSQTTFEDNVRLVDPKPNEILVTNQIVQSRELKVSSSSSSTEGARAGMGAGVGVDVRVGVEVGVAIGGKDVHRYQKTAAPPKYSWS